MQQKVDYIIKKNKHKILEYKKSKKITNTIFKQASIANTLINENLIQENNVGNLDLTCKFCNAKHYTFELSQDKNFSTCCHKGKINLQEDPTYPREIEELVTGNTCISKNFKQFIRYYNNITGICQFWSYVSIITR